MRAVRNTDAGPALVEVDEPTGDHVLLQRLVVEHLRDRYRPGGHGVDRLHPRPRIRRPGRGRPRVRGGTQPVVRRLRRVRERADPALHRNAHQPRNLRRRRAVRADQGSRRQPGGPPDRSRRRQRLPRRTRGGGLARSRSGRRPAGRTARGGRRRGDRPAGGGGGTPPRTSRRPRRPLSPPTRRGRASRSRFALRRVRRRHRGGRHRDRARPLRGAGPARGPGGPPRRLPRPGAHPRRRHPGEGAVLDRGDGLRPPRRARGRSITSPPCWRRPPTSPPRSSPTASPWRRRPTPSG